MLLGSVLIGAGCAVGGYWLARALDASIAGAMATVVGVVFGLVYLLAPEHGRLTQRRRRREQRYRFAGQMLLIHLAGHEGTPREGWESRAVHLQEHFGWSPDFSAEIVRRVDAAGYVVRKGEHLRLTDRGHAQARAVLGEEARVD